MPVYEYLCSVCKHISERERKMSERKKVTVCDSCGSRKTELVISHSTFELKSGGSGWANTGYSKGGAPSKAPKKVGG